VEQNYIQRIISGLDFQASSRQIDNLLKLFEEGATIPFIARYRKEATGGLDEVQIAAVKERFEKLKELDNRREAILKSIEEQGKLTDELKAKINSAISLTELEDIYLPYKPKRKTRASVAKENGLEPLADMIFKQQDIALEKIAQGYLNEKVASIDDALQGARDIIAEKINEDVAARNSIRNLFNREAVIISKVVKNKEEEGAKYKDYFDFEEPLKRCASHRLLAIRRGEAEGFLRVSIEPQEDNAIYALQKLFVKSRFNSAKQVELAVTDSYKRLLQPSIENEFAALTKEKADAEAIKVFAENLRQLLLSAPLGNKAVLAIDPGFRTGCKIVCLDKQGKMLVNETIYPHPPHNDLKTSIAIIQELVDEFKIEAIAIGNGTAGRETEHIVRNMVKFSTPVQIFVVSENGASIYSASDVAREEFPDYDVTVRGSISIGRRLIDPLAELVKIDPKSIGVGQYQHDVDQKELKKKLDDVVVSCVNQVGVNVNTASKHLLTYISGLNKQLAQNIVSFRDENGAFKSRTQLKKVPRMGEKSFEQSAGFLRVDNSDNPLDNSAVHPESYHIVEKMAKDLNCKIADLIHDEKLRKQIDISKYVTDKIGIPTLSDILNELAKPGRDPREVLKEFQFSDSVHTIEDLRVGMELPGIVTNLTNFGAFVDLGIKISGLIHRSHMGLRYNQNPVDVVNLHQQIKVKVLEVDISRSRVQLEWVREVKHLK
jgi:protein Tex